MRRELGVELFQENQEDEFGRVILPNAVKFGDSPIEVVVDIDYRYQTIGHVDNLRREGTRILGDVTFTNDMDLTSFRRHVCCTDITFVKSLDSPRDLIISCVISLITYFPVPITRD